MLQFLIMPAEYTRLNKKIVKLSESNQNIISIK